MQPHTPWAIAAWQQQCENRSSCSSGSEQDC
jgi:hypothetical protein